MDTSRWASYLRLQERWRVTRDSALADALEGVLDRELTAILRGQPRTGTDATAIANHRRRERRRARILATLAVVSPDHDDPWPQVEARQSLQTGFARLDEGAVDLLLSRGDGVTYEALAASRRRPVGTIKAQVHRARLKFAA